MRVTLYVTGPQWEICNLKHESEEDATSKEHISEHALLAQKILDVSQIRLANHDGHCSSRISCYSPRKLKAQVGAGSAGFE
jgi:hypothetical protein